VLTSPKERRVGVNRAKGKRDTKSLMNWKVGK